jgi:hypothetical protein
LISPKFISTPIQRKSFRIAITTKSLSNSILNELNTELAKIPPTRRHYAVVLDAETDANLTRFCQEKSKSSIPI